MCWFLSENDRKRRDILTKFNDQDVEFHINRLNNLDSITVNRNPTVDIELSNKKYVDDEWSENTKLWFRQSLQNYLTVFDGNTEYNLTRYDRKQILDTNIFGTGNAGSFFLHFWIIECNDRKIAGKKSSSLRPTKTNSPSGNTGATISPAIGDCSMYIEASNFFGTNAFLSLERIDSIQISNITFYYNRYSKPTNNLISKGQLQINYFHLMDNGIQKV